MLNDTEAATVALLAQQASSAETLEPGKIYTLLDGTGGLRVVDTMKYSDRPARKTGTSSVRDTESFIDFLEKHGVPEETEITAFQDQRMIVANVDAGTDSAPGYGEHSAKLTLKLTAEWTQWVERSGKLMDQETFAEFIEDHAGEIMDPSSADIMEIASTLQVKRGVEFEQGTKLSTGEVQFTFRESDKTSAGKAGQLAIPDQLTLALSPFKGGEPYKVTAKFRYRLRSSELALGYKLQDVVKIQDNAFNEIAEAVRTYAGAKNFLFLNA